MGAIDRRAADIARRQRGYATRQQLVDEAAISRATISRRLASGHWSEPMPGVIMPAQRRQTHRGGHGARL